jgi:uncharacterized protein (TIGR02598 family)
MRLPPSQKNVGFTLVEVIMAIGVISVALLAMIGLLPTGLGALRDSNQQFVNAQIVQRISSGWAATGFANRSDFASFTGTNLYFDSRAQLLSGSDGAQYRAVVTARPPSMPGMSVPEALAFSSSLKRLGVSISRVDIANSATNSYALQISYR